MVQSRPIARSIAPLVEAALLESRVVALVGARQVGKSTLVRGLGRPYYTLDDFAVRSFAQGDPAGFIRGLPFGAIVDEVQLVPSLLREIKGAVDLDDAPGRFLLTGSANILTLPALADPLVGRMRTLPLHPFAEAEIEASGRNVVDDLFEPDLAWPEAETSGDALIERLLRGGYPEPHRLRTEASRAAWFSQYVLGMMQREVREIARIDDLTAMQRLLSIIAARSGRLFSPTALASDTGIPKTTLLRYLAILEQTFLVESLPAWAADPGRKQVKAPKMFVNDVGLAAHEMGVDSLELAKNRNPLGTLVETLVFNEIRKQASWSKAHTRLFHSRTHGGDEVDLILERGSRRVAIEIKAAASVESRDTRSIRRLVDASGLGFVRGVVVYTGSRVIPAHARIHAVPIAGLWAKRR
jgi:predicted AAA+ superfamily ATPase